MSDHHLPKQHDLPAPPSSSMVETGHYRYERNRRSHEYFSPGPHSKLRTATAPSAIFNLVSTIIGGGVLSLPYAFDKCGLVLATLFMMAAAAASTFSLYVIVSCSRRGGATTFEEIVRKALGPRAGLITVTLLVLVTFLTMVAYVILTKDLVSSLAQQFLYGRPLSIVEKNAWTIIVVMLILPVLFARTMNALRFTSIFSLVSVLVLAVAIAIRALNASTISASETSIKWFPSNWKDPMYAFPIMSVSFLCHFNVLPVYHELQKPTRQRLKQIVTSTMISTWFFYMVVGIMGYMFAYRRPGGVKDDILNNFESTDHLVNVGRLGLLVTILLSMPLLVQPCRLNVLRWCKHVNALCSSSSSEEQSMLLDTPTMTPTSSTVGARSDHRVHVVLTIVLLSSAIALALELPGVAVVWNLMGSTVGLLISYVLPCVSYVLIRREKPNSDKRKMAAWGIFVVSTIVCIACTIQAIDAIVNP